MNLLQFSKSMLNDQTSDSGKASFLVNQANNMIYKFEEYHSYSFQR